MTEGYEVSDLEEYCYEMCYHEHLCDSGCIDWECYFECVE